MNWHEYVNATGKVPAWPYEINYGREHVIKTDVLIIGGGVAGIRAAISAKQHGATVAVADRGAAKYSGAGGAGVDHWHGAVLNPCSKITPRQYSDVAMYCDDGYCNGSMRYIVGKEGWDTLLELEKWGMQIRDVKDEFVGSIFRDDETKLMFAYDVDNKHCLRVWGNNIKRVAFAEAKRLGVDIYDRICIFSLLTEGGVQGARVCGALGVHDRTGEFYIFRCKAAVVATGGGSRIGGLAPELNAASAMGDLNLTGIGHTIGWKAGAQLVMMEQAGTYGGGFGYTPYSMGNSDNTYQGAPTVDYNGKPIAFATRYGKLLDDYRDVFRTSNPDTFVLGHGIGVSFLKPGSANDYEATHLDPKIGEKVRSGEFKMPLYNDFTDLSDLDRRAIYNLMLAHEGKCRVPIFETWNEAGFDPARDLLQCVITTPDTLYARPGWVGINAGPNNWFSPGSGGYLTDWRLQSTIPGLFVAGGRPIFGGGCHGESHTTGRYSGRQAAAFARANDFAEANPEQIKKEKDAAYTPVNNKGDIGWKELNYAIARVMADYCGHVKTEEVLNLGLKRLADMRESEGERTFVNNPHELARMVEDYSFFDLGQCYIEAAKARKASSNILRFTRIDYPEVDPEEWHKLIPLSLKDGEVVAGSLDCWFYKKGPYSEDLESNYVKYAELD
ncbi:MAG: FAD-binding protein [Clostridiales bacterium]|nr:FAD-binding protein [Clostridiales bacterium]